MCEAGAGVQKTQNGDNAGFEWTNRESVVIPYKITTHFSKVCVVELYVILPIL